jgi:hypothetical protein
MMKEGKYEIEVEDFDMALPIQAECQLVFNHRDMAWELEDLEVKIVGGSYITHLLPEAKLDEITEMALEQANGEQWAWVEQ